ncbi:MAG: hypothetical protein KAG53_04295 [Endozoicomonadaceae bacterium]|nr:hypothetical protein [Endozoicomonadaceae bacterium]
MLIINCTKAAVDFFTVSRKAKKVTVVEAAPQQTLTQSMAEQAEFQNAQWQWLVHAIKVGGKHVLITMDCQSRFSITLTGIKKGDHAEFLNALEHHLIVHIYEIMTNAEVSEQAVEASVANYQKQHSNHTFYQRSDLSTQAHINDVAWHFRRASDKQGHVLTGVDLIEQDVFINQLIRKRGKIKNYFFPYREFLRLWLVRFSGHTVNEADIRIAQLQAKEPAEFAEQHPELIASHSLPPTVSTKNTASNTATPPSNKNNNVIVLDDYRK